MKKIVHIAQSAGGVAEYLYLLLSNMDNNKYENILIVSDDYKEQILRFENITNKIYFVPMKRDINIKSDLYAIRQVRKILKKIKPNVVYLHSSKAGAIGRIALAFNFATKVIYNAHGWYFNAEIDEKKKKVFTLIEKILAIKTNIIINISKSEYDSAVKRKISKPEKMCIIDNGIDLKKFKNNEINRNTTREKYSIKEDEFVIGVVGRLDEQKDPMTSIKAFKLIHQKNSNTKLMFVGSGKLEKEILEYAKRNNLEDKVIITGWIKNVEKIIPAFDVATLPSRWEGFGLAIIEYMACDKPIVATNVGGIADIIKNDENGLLVDIEDYKMLAEKINLLMTNKGICNKMIEINKMEREKYSIKNTITLHDNIL